MLSRIQQNQSARCDSITSRCERFPAARPEKSLPSGGLWEDQSNSSPSGALWCFQTLVLVCNHTPLSSHCNSPRPHPPRPRCAFVILIPSFPTQHQDRLLCDSHPVFCPHSRLLNMKDPSGGKGAGCSIAETDGGRYEDEHAQLHYFSAFIVYFHLRFFPAASFNLQCFNLSGSCVFIYLPIYYLMLRVSSVCLAPNKV